MNAQQPDHLALDRSKANLLFSSWRLNSSILRSEGCVQLPAPAAPAQASNTDYIVARHAALLNGITQQPRGCFVFLEEQHADQGQQKQRLGLYQLDLGEATGPPGLHRVCGLPDVAHEVPAGGLAAGELPPSVVEVQPAAPDAAAAGSGASDLLLVSSGRGDLSLAFRPAGSQQQPAAGRPGATALLSPPVFPLRLPLPLRGVRPVHLAAAFQLPPPAAPSADGSQSAGEGRADICCVLWAARPRTARQPSRCEVFAVRLAVQLAPTPALQMQQMQQVQLLKVSDLPPHGVLVNPATGGVLLALQPSSASLEDEAAAQRAAAAAGAAAGAATAASGGGGASGAAAGAAAAGSGGDAMEEDAVSPRSLAAAVARLAAYTSQEPVGPLPHQQYADLYHEAGADGVGAMGAEPTCSLYTFALEGSGAAAQAAAAQEAAAQEAAGSNSQAGQQQQEQQAPGLLRLVHVLSCQPHKLLTCHLELPAGGAQEPPTPDTHLQGAGGSTPQRQQTSSGGRGGSSRLLLGLTDDVDCAVVAISCSRGGGSGGGGDSEAEGAGFVIEHVASVPAMAYVAAGKVQRKFLLLARPGGDISTALVEAIKYCYLYRSTGPKQENGEHQVADMELPDSGGRGVLGAVLAGSRGGACRLVLLAREGLRVIDM